MQSPNPATNRKRHSCVLKIISRRDQNGRAQLYARGGMAIFFPATSTIFPPPGTMSPVLAAFTNPAIAHLLPASGSNVLILITRVVGVPGGSNEAARTG